MRLGLLVTPAHTTVQRALGHAFADLSLLDRALTHRSFGAAHNERLEFLGDAVLSASVATLLVQAHPDAAEGELSRLRSVLVRQDPLHKLALAVGLPAALKLGEGELRSGGATRPSILADAMEAVIGAVYLDGGFAASHAVVARLLGPQIADARAQQGAAKDPKTALQEWLQAHQRPLPVYRVQMLSGQAHAQQFEVVCSISPKASRGKASAMLEASGTGATRRAAEKAAAQAMLGQLGVA